MRILLTICCFSLAMIAAAQNGRPNIVLFIADDVSWEDLGGYGNTIVQTPNIDKLAANGLRFDNVYLTASSCSPSRNSILTGRYPHNTGAAELHTRPPMEMRSFPEILRENGYYTAHSGKYHSGPYVERGFDQMINDGESVGNGGENAWLQVVDERPEDQPFFFWFAAFDAHRGWGPNEFSGRHKANEVAPPPYLAKATATREDLAKYYDEIYRFDHHIGLVVDALTEQGVLDNTMIIVMADNGRPFPHSKTRVNDRGMKTPFIISWPEQVQQAAQSQALVSAIDIAPTVLHVAGLRSGEQIQGQSFLPVIQDPRKPFRSYAFAEHNWHDYEAHERMVRSKDFMYIRNWRPALTQMGPADAVGSPAHADLQELQAAGSITEEQADVFRAPRPAEELYDLRVDPNQWNNLAEDKKYRKDLKALQQILEEWMEETGDSAPESLTKDWYEKEPGYIKTDQHGIRGEMPGAIHNAATINNKSKF